MSNCKLRSLDG